MIKRLSISQYVIIENLTIDFSEGLTVLTGETGAGKSILLDAMGLILGDDPDREAIRQNAEESVIEALFVPSDSHPVWAFLSQKFGATVSGPELEVKRSIGRRGKDEILVNGSSFDLPSLKELGTYLVEIHGQFANQTFLAPESQLSLLDAFGAYPPNVLTDVSKAWAEIGTLTRLLEEEKVFFANAEREKTSIERVIADIEKIGLQKNGYEALQEKLAELINTRDITNVFQSANAQLVAQSGAELSLSRVDRILEGQQDPVLEVMKTSVRTALEQTRVAISEMRRLAPKYLDCDTSGIRDIEKTLETIRTIAGERKVAPEELFSHYEYLVERLARIRGAPAKIKKLEDDLFRANDHYRRCAHLLSQERAKAAQKLSAVINEEMSPLKLMSAQIRIDVTEDTEKPTVRGFNEASFMARMNPGMPFSPIAKTASGGELARLILAVKMVLQKVQIVSTLVFDEIDTGIGGAAAAAVGSRIAQLAEAAQILVITHSPQVASRGDQHLHVSKRTDGATTRTLVRFLDLEERVEEISRMLAGEVPTHESAAAARTLIEEARQSVAARKAEAEAQIAAKAKMEAELKAKMEAEAKEETQSTPPPSAAS